MALWCIAFLAAIAAPWLGLRLAAGVVTGLLATTLFLTGHDCGHGAFTGCPKVDRRVGRIVMLPSLQAASIWWQRHNTAHHRWPNLRGRDFVWVPLDCERYATAGPAARWRARLERTTIGLVLHSTIELWWRQQIRAVGVTRLSPVQARDRRWVWTWLAVTSGVAAVGSSRLHHDRWLAPTSALMGLLTAVVVPFVVTMWLQGFGTFYNHTDPEVPWFDDEPSWAAAGAQLTCSVQVSFSAPLSWFLGNVFEHPAHHLDPRIPLPQLAEAQSVLTETMTPSVVHRRWSLRHHRQVLRTCRLYDYREHRWVDFDGTPTTPPLRPSLLGDLCIGEEAAR